MPRPYYDGRFGACVVKLLPGQSYVTDRPEEMILTVLGTCVAACVTDPQAAVGGMNHFMLPESSDGRWGPEAARRRFGNFAMPDLIEAVVSRGGRRDRLDVKLFGGARLALGGAVGLANADYAEAWLAAHGLPASATALRGAQPLRVHFFPTSGRALVRELAGTAAVAAAAAVPALALEAH